MLGTQSEEPLPERSRIVLPLSRIRLLEIGQAVKTLPAERLSSQPAIPWAQIDRLNALRHLKVTLLFTYSGIDDRRIEPYPSSVAADSLRLTSAPAQRRYRTILYWRPLVPGLNDSCEHLDMAYALACHADVTVFTGLFYRNEIAAYYRASGLPEPYGETARRKIVPETLERRVLATFDASTPLFRKTSCAVSFVHGLPDYNGPDPEDESGRGLLIVAGLSKQWNYYRLAEGGKWVWAELAIPVEWSLLSAVAR